MVVIYDISSRCAGVASSSMIYYMSDIQSPASTEHSPNVTSKYPSLVLHHVQVLLAFFMGSLSPIEVKRFQ
jgi:hypothetical protein